MPALVKKNFPSLEKIGWDQDEDTVTWKASVKGYFKGTERHFSSLDFIAQLTLHIPPQGKHMLRRYGVIGVFIIGAGQGMPQSAQP